MDGILGRMKFVLDTRRHSFNNVFTLLAEIPHPDPLQKTDQQEAQNKREQNEDDRERDWDFSYAGETVCFQSGTSEATKTVQGSLGILKEALL